MQQNIRRLTALFLALILMLPEANSIITYAQTDPMDGFELSVPEELQDGGNWYFIRENTFNISEVSDQKLYIPIQRTGDLSAEGEVALKLIDVTSKHNVNYKEKIYRENPESEVEIADLSILELTEGSILQEEFDPAQEEELNNMIDVQGADIIDAEGNLIGEVAPENTDETDETVEVIAENEETVQEPSGEVISEETVVTEESPVTETEIVNEEENPAIPEAEPQTPALEEDSSVEESDWEKAESTGPSALREGRDQFTGTDSDRQKMAVDDSIIGGGEETEEDVPELIEDAYPGKVYTLHFDANESVKYLVITPLYSDAADGDTQLMLMLKDPAETNVASDAWYYDAISWTAENGITVGLNDEPADSESARSAQEACL